MMKSHLSKIRWKLCDNKFQKAEILANFFSVKMSVCDPLKLAHEVPGKTNVKLDCNKITQTNVLKVLKQVDRQKAMGPGKISPNRLSICAHELAGPLTKPFRNCMLQKKRPKILKKADVTAMHKKSDRSSVKTVGLYL